MATEALPICQGGCGQPIQPGTRAYVYGNGDHVCPDCLEDTADWLGMTLDQVYATPPDELERLDAEASQSFNKIGEDIRRDVAENGALLERAEAELFSE